MYNILTPIAFPSVLKTVTFPNTHRLGTRLLPGHVLLVNDTPISVPTEVPTFMWVLLLLSYAAAFDPAVTLFPLEFTCKAYGLACGLHFHTGKSLCMYLPMWIAAFVSRPCDRPCTVRALCSLPLVR